MEDNNLANKIEQVEKKIEDLALHLTNMESRLFNDIDCSNPRQIPTAKSLEFSLPANKELDVTVILSNNKETGVLIKSKDGSIRQPCYYFSRDGSGVYHFNQTDNPRDIIICAASKDNKIEQGSSGWHNWYTAYMVGEPITRRGSKEYEAGWDESNQEGIFKNIRVIARIEDP